MNDIITEFYNTHLPEAILLACGILVLWMLHEYRQDDESGMYKLALVICFLAGIFTLVMTITGDVKWTSFTTILTILMAFTIIMRPFKEVNFAIVISVFVMLVIFLYLGKLATSDIELLRSIATGWGRVIVAFILGAVCYMVLNFFNAIVMGLAKLFNWLPFAAFIAILCIAEGLSILFMGHSIWYYIVG